MAGDYIARGGADGVEVTGVGRAWQDRGMTVGRDRSSLVVVVIAGFLLGGCEEAAPAAPPVRATPPSAPVETPEELARRAAEQGPPPPSRVARTMLRRGREIALDEAPAEARAAFWAAIREGRRLTRGRRYAAAVERFDEALAALADHPMALAGRGYARLLQGDLDGAAADLGAVQAMPGPREVEAMIATQLGELAEKRGDAAAARRHFSRADALLPSKATAAKVGKARVCPVEVTEAARLERFDSWTALWAMLAREGLVDTEPAPLSEAVAQKIVCHSEWLDEGATTTFDACAEAPAGPWVSRRYSEAGEHALVVVRADAAGRLSAAIVGRLAMGPCGANSRATVNRGEATVIHWERWAFAPIEAKEDPSGGLVACEGEPGCARRCSDELDGETIDLVLSQGSDVVTAIRGPLLAGEGTRGLAAAEVRVEGGSLRISGAQCEEVMPLPGR
jgi:tetratricopeptide (TPR) repeat protein